MHTVLAAYGNEERGERGGRRAADRDYKKSLVYAKKQKRIFAKVCTLYARRGHYANEGLRSGAMKPSSTPSE